MFSNLWMNIRKIFGDNVRYYRMQSGLSQAAVAVSMGVDRAYISSIERGGQNATLHSVLEVAQALNVRPADLLDETERPVADAITADETSA